MARTQKPEPSEHLREKLLAAAKAKAEKAAADKAAAEKAAADRKSAATCLSALMERGKKNVNNASNMFFGCVPRVLLRFVLDVSQSQAAALLSNAQKLTIEEEEDEEGLEFHS